MRLFHFPSCAIAVWAVLAFAALPPVAQAVSPAKVFPDFAKLKNSLGVIPLVADVVVVEDVLGNVEKVYVEDCRRIGESVLDRFATAMTQKGYRVEKRPLLSVGQTLSAEKSYRRLATWKQHTMDEAAFPAGPPPLYVDSTQCRDRLQCRDWAALMRRTAGFQLSGGMPEMFPEGIALRNSNGHDFVFVITVVSNRIPQGKAFLHDVLTPLPTDVSVLSALSPCDADYNNGVVFSPVSSSLCRVALVDCRHGEAVWADGECRGGTFSENRIESMTQNILKRLP